MRGRPSTAPYSPRESGSEPRSPLRSDVVALSTSKLRATATRAPPGHEAGFNRRPALTRNICRLSSSSDRVVPGWRDVLGAGGCPLRSTLAQTIEQAAASVTPMAARFIAFLPGFRPTQCGRRRLHLVPRQSEHVAGSPLQLARRPRSIPDEKTGRHDVRVDAVGREVLVLRQVVAFEEQVQPAIYAERNHLRDARIQGHVPPAVMY